MPLPTLSDVAIIPVIPVFRLPAQDAPEKTPRVMMAMIKIPVNLYLRIVSSSCYLITIALLFHMDIIRDSEYAFSCILICNHIR